MYGRCVLYEILFPNAYFYPVVVALLVELSTTDPRVKASNPADIPHWKKLQRKTKMSTVFYQV